MIKDGTYSEVLYLGRIRIVRRRTKEEICFQKIVFKNNLVDTYFPNQLCLNDLFEQMFRFEKEVRENYSQERYSRYAK